MRRLVSAAEFAQLAKAGKARDAGAAITIAGSMDGAATGRTVPYVFSDESVARDKNTISTAGWQLSNFQSNPVALWAHDMSQPPIGRVVSITKSGKLLRGAIQYADAETYPFADTVFRLVKGRYLNAVSVSWDPIDWKLSTDPTRRGGIDFLKQDLLEVSQVPVPSLVSALATARGAGIDTAPLYAWASQLLDAGGMTTVPRRELEALYAAARPAGPTTFHDMLHSRASLSTPAERTARAKALKAAFMMENDPATIERLDRARERRAALEATWREQDGKH